MPVVDDTADGAGSERLTTWQLRLYIAGWSARSHAALEIVRSVCDRFAPHRYVIDVVDLADQPQRAHDLNLVAIPTLVRLAPLPTRQIIGNLFDADAVLSGLEAAVAQRDRTDGAGLIH